MKRGLKILLLLLFAIPLFVFIALSCFNQRVPDFVLDRLLASISSSNIIFRAEEADFRLTRGLRVKDLRVLDCTRRNPAPIITADLVDIRMSFFPFSPQTLVRHVAITSLRYARLPDGYYIPDSIEFPGQPDFKEKNEPLKFSFPHMKSFSLFLDEPEILSVRPSAVHVESVSALPSKLSLSGIRIDWPDRDYIMKLNGEMVVDASLQLVKGMVCGQARQSNIRPLLVALDITNSLPFIDSFTGVRTPVDASCRFNVNLRNNDLRIILDLHPSNGKYNSAPFKRADGPVDIRVFVRDTYQNAEINVGPLVTEMADGSIVSGAVKYFNTNDLGFVVFDVKSHTSLSNALAIADVLNDGTLDCLQPTTHPVVTLNGLLAVDPANAASNNLSGTIAFERGSLFSIPLSNASSAFSVLGTTVSFTNATASAPHGGFLSGSASLSIPEFKQEHASFNVNVKGNRLTLEDLANALRINTGDRYGILDGELSLSGPLSSDSLPRLSGSGHVSISEGHVARMPVFMGLTDYLAAKIPGIGRITDQSRASLSFSITNGIFSTSNLLVEGSFFSIHGSGSYDMVHDKLDFVVQVRLFRNDSLLEKLATPFNWTLSKMLMEFKVFGPVNHADWKYAGIVDRIISSAEKTSHLVTPSKKKE